jgi:hypothetical protein
MTTTAAEASRDADAERAARSRGFIRQSSPFDVEPIRQQCSVVVTVQ